MGKPKGKRTKAANGTRVNGKAANGAGSVWYDPARSRWTAEHRSGDLRVRAIGKTQQLARDRLAAKLEDMALPATGWDRKTVTVAEFADWWQATKRSTVQPSSAAKYAQRVERIKAGLGHLKLRDLTAPAISSWLGSLDLGPSTISDIRSTLAQITKSAVGQDLIPKDPIAFVPAPRVDTVERRSLTKQELSRLLDASNQHRLGAAVVLLFTQGLRASEVLGLRWLDIDLDAREMTVRQALKYVDGVGNVIGAPKSDGARGIHHLTETAIEALRTHQALQNDAEVAAKGTWSPKGEGLVFRSVHGGLLGRQALGRAVAEVAELAKVDPEGLGTHGGRRTVITLAYQNGLDIDDVARHVGHADRRTTAGYVQNLGIRPKDTADRINQIVSGAV